MVFKPGQSGNPTGKPKQKLFSDALRVEVLHAHDEHYVIPKGATNLQVIARKLVEQAKEGNTAATKEIADRIEGKPDANVNIDHSGSIAHEHEGVSETLGWLRGIAGAKASSEIKESLPH